MDATEDTPFPDISDALLATLERLYPEKSADLHWSDREVWHKAGQCDVVRALREQHRRQNTTILAE